jgi:hypothetical protein
MDIDPTEDEMLANVQKATTSSEELSIEDRLTPIQR